MLTHRQLGSVCKTNFFSSLQAHTNVLLYVVVILVIIVIISGLALTIICIKRNIKPDGEATGKTYTVTRTTETSHFSPKMTFQ